MAVRRFQFRPGTPRARLASLFPELAGTAFAVESTPLGGNAWNTVAVQRHRVRLADGSTGPECVEKQLSKPFGIAPYEARMQDWAASASGQPWLVRTSHLGVIHTPLACFIYSQAGAGVHAHLGRSAAQAGQGLAEMEAASALRLAELARTDAFACWHADFFRPWTLWRPRYNLALAMRQPDLRRAPSLRRVHELARLLQVALRDQTGEVRGSARCLSHLDMLSKNFIETPAGLQLIDWGEGRIGRFGFDAGSYLHRLLRGNSVAVYAPAADTLLDSYLGHLPAHVDAGQARRNAFYFLALRTLCYFLRAPVLREQAAAPQALEEKLDVLLAAVKGARAGR